MFESKPATDTNNIENNGGNEGSSPENRETKKNDVTNVNKHNKNKNIKNIKNAVSLPKKKWALEFPIAANINPRSIYGKEKELCTLIKEYSLD